MSTQDTGLKPTRRTLVKGAAWSVPVVAVAGAAPAMAASQEVTITGTGQACKSPGASCEKDYGITKGYFIEVLVCTDVRSQVTIDFGTASVSLGGATPSSGWTIKPDPLVIPAPTNPGDTSERCQTVVLGIQGEPNSQNVSIDGSAPFTWTSANGLSGSGTMTFSASATPPCEKCGSVTPK